MKKIFFSLVAATALSSSLYAGKNVEIIQTEPKPLPVPTTLPPLGLYIGGGATYATSGCVCDDSIKCADGSTCADYTATTYGINLKAGYDFTDYIGIEAKYLYTPWGDEGRALTHYGVYLKPNFAVTDSFDAYALIGYGQTKCESMEEAYTGLAWGVGTEYSFGKRTQGIKEGFGVYAEYLKPLYKKDPTIDANVVNGGIVYHF